MARFASFLLRLAVTLVAVVLATVIGWQLWVYYMESPWTRDGRVRADVVAVAPDVSGLVTEVLVHDNQEVKAGDVLFRIDRERFPLALRHAEADVAGRKAALDLATAEFGRFQALTTTWCRRSSRSRRRRPRVRPPLPTSRRWPTAISQSSTLIAPN